MSKIRCNQQVRGLLVELDTIIQQYNVETAALGVQGIGASFAVEMGARRKLTESRILGCANRINKASKGELA